MILSRQGLICFNRKDLLGIKKYIQIASIIPKKDYQTSIYLNYAI